jgi:two-component system nitrogen regulation response regulator GlnG
MSPSPPTEVIRVDTGSELLLQEQARLLVTEGPHRGQSARLRYGSLVVGSSPDCGLALAEDRSLSARQFEIQVTPRGFELRDLGSTNGTWIGGLRVERAWLTDRTIIRAGRSHFELAPEDARESFPLSPRHGFGRLIGRSPVMRRCFAILEQAAQTTSTVLIEGESGTGKELAAEAIHQQSPRREGPFVVVDCGSIPANLIESELFGHERGAFTGATAPRAGAFERADGGTLFLDEIGELHPSLQPRLLRFLEKRQSQRVGGSAVRTLDVRVVAATNRRLQAQVEDGGFRQDLYYRLAVIHVELPALRHHIDDVPMLALELARQLLPDVDPCDWLDDATLAVLAAHHWPGNVRELRNVVERLAALPGLPPALGGPGTNAPPPSDDGLGLDRLTELPYHQAKERLLERFERRYLEAVLEDEQGVVARAAERAGVPRQTLFRLIRKHGLR